MPADIWTVLDLLQNAKAPERSLDWQIGTVADYRTAPPRPTNDVGADADSAIWTHRSRETASQMPNFTGSIAAAYELARSLAPLSSGGVSWEAGKGSARIGDGRYCQGATPAIALCVAALRHKLDTEL